MNTLETVLTWLGAVAALFVLYFIGFCVYAIWRICTKGDE